MYKGPILQPTHTPPSNAPPSYNQAMGGPPVVPLAGDQSFRKGPPIITTIVPVGPHSTHMVCPHCHSEIMTVTDTQPGNLAIILGAVICFFGGFLGCCLIPCCVDSLMDVHHTCPLCKQYLGRFRR